MKYMIINNKHEYIMTSNNAPNLYYYVKNLIDNDFNIINYLSIMITGNGTNKYKVVKYTNVLSKPEIFKKYDITKVSFGSDCAYHIYAKLNPNYYSITLKDIIKTTNERK